MALAFYQFTALIKTDVAGRNAIANQALTVNISGGGLATIYSDAAGTTPIAQPGAQTDSDGNFGFYAESGSYDIVSGGRTETVNLRDTDDLIGYEPTVTSLKSRPVVVGDVVRVGERANGIFEAKTTGAIVDVNLPNGNNIIASTFDPSICFVLFANQRINALEWGVINDKTIDSTLIIQDLINYSDRNDRAIYFPAGNYLCGNITIPLTTSLTDIRGDGRHKTNFWCKSGTIGKWWDAPSAQKLQLFDMAFYGQNEAGLTHVFNAGDVVPMGTEANAARLWFRDAPNAILCRILGNVLMVDSVTVQSGRIGCELGGAYNFWQNFVIVDTTETALIGSSGTYSNFEFEAMADGTEFIKIQNDCYMDGVIISPTAGYTHANAIEIDAGAVNDWSVDNLTIVTGATITKTFKQGSKEWDALNGSSKGYVATNQLAVGQDAASIPIISILKSVESLDFPSIAAGGSQSLSFTLTGAIGNMPVILGYPSAGTNSGLVYEPRVSSSDTVTVTCKNHTAGAIDPPAQTFVVTVINYA